MFNFVAKLFLLRAKPLKYKKEIKDKNGNVRKTILKTYYVEKQK